MNNFEKAICYPVRMVTVFYRSPLTAVYFMNCLDIAALLLIGLYWPLLLLQRPAVKATVQQQRKMREEQKTTGINQTPKAAASQAGTSLSEV